MKYLQFFIVMCLVFCLVGCDACIDKSQFIRNLETHETGFLVDAISGDTVDGNKIKPSNPKEYMNVDYLSQNVVRAKTIVLPFTTVSTGLMPWQYKVIPTKKLLIVNNTSITRVWTSDKDTGTSLHDEGFSVESKESIGFNVGVECTGRVTPEDSPTYLCMAAGIPFQEFMDKTIRSKIQITLFEKFGELNLPECKTNKSQIARDTFVIVRDHFKTFGITIDALGLRDGLKYDEPENQTAINKAYAAEMSIKEEEMKAEAQENINKRIVSESVAQREAAEEFQKASDAMVAKTKLEIEKIKAESFKIMADKWNGSVPSGFVMFPGSAGSGGTGMDFLMQIPQVNNN